jgi:hypothetical protein
MTSYQNVAQPVRHFFTQLTALVALYGVLGMSIHSEAKVHEPFHCWTCCPPNNCGDGEDVVWKRALGTHVNTANLGYQKIKPTKAELLGEAAYMVDWANAREQDGTIGAYQTEILNDAVSIYSVVPNGQNLFLYTANFGNVIPLSGWTVQLEKTILTERKAAIAFIQTYGLYGTLIFYSDILTQWANTIGGKHPSPVVWLQALDGKFYPNTITPAMARTFFDGMAIVGMFVAGLPPGDPIGLIIAGGAMAGLMYMDSQGM